VKKRKGKAFRKPQSQKKTGLPPGKVVYIGDEKQTEVKISVIDYNESHLEERSVS
jgi:hypothetical protein